MPHKPPLEELHALIRAARRRLRVRSMVRVAALGGWLGAAAGTVASGAAGALGAESLLAVALGLGVGAAFVGVAGGVGLLLPTLTAREAALLLDRRLGTRELFVTALHVTDRANQPAGRDPHAAEVLHDLRGRLDERVRLGAAVPLGLPRHARFLPLTLLLIGGAALVPHARGPDAQAEPAPLAAEGQRLAQRVEAIASEEGAALPPELRQEASELGRDMEAGRLDEEEARRRLAELQERLSAFEQSLAPSNDLLEELEEAARALDSEATADLARALESGDLAEAAEAAGDLSEQLASAPAEQRQQAAEGLSRAGEQLAGSGDPSLREAGEAMQQAAEQVASGEMDPARARELAQQLDQAEQLGERLQRDREALERSQELNGALEASRQRLGGEPSVDDGESSEGEGQGEGEGRGEGQGQIAGQGQPGGPGSAHTWEDQGEHESSAGSSSEDRLGERTEGKVVDDFERLYASVRLEGAEALLASERGKLDASGRVDELVTRRTGSEQRSELPRLDLPATYEAAAAEAIRTESVPPGYRDAVKQYFAEME